MSNFAFGTYRISDLNPQHVEALKEAIDAGITMIDTSSNYMDGGAERAIALAFREYEDKINDVEIVSKFGYIQGENLAAHKENPIDGAVVEFSENCYHCISKVFLHEQLTQTLKRLERKQIDTYLIHNPEYYLIDAVKKGLSEDERLDEMYIRIEEAFTAMELEVKAGRILSYGISSNSFSVAHDSEEFLPYEDLITLAENAAKEIGNVAHSFTTIQLPINLLETDGFLCAAWAKKNNLRVLANRPFNAKYEDLMFRLCDYDESLEYFHHFNELMEVCDNDQLRPLHNLLEQLDGARHKFGWIGDYDSFLYAQVVPHIRSCLEVVDEANKQTMLNFIDLYLQEYRKMVLYECSKATRTQLKEFFGFSLHTMQEIAIDYLMRNDSIDYILVGMRKPSYVHEILALKK